jgi:CpeT/CpcT family (DUF1001)
MAKFSALLLAGGLCLLSGCSTTSARGEKALQEFVALLPGSYDNLAQSRLLPADGSPAHTALRLIVAPVQAPLVGDHVFYVQEMAADDLRRVLAQRLYVVNLQPGGGDPVLAQLDFNEPGRWRDGHLNRDLFRSLLTTDLRMRTGCDLIWTRSTSGFAATNNPAQCRTSSRATGEALHVEQRMQLGQEGLDLFDRYTDSAGTVVFGGDTDPYYRFSRRADAPW